ncbi:MAG: phospho-N-acetylmuramoyl-pentapeptide-transferase [Candidatus Kerfeldbacteria bacterium]|nr:phospho-N-acetylmuramoyl-pentapeptide-transferase [Candidatus Kerfeldbacteria bacterium]
MFEDFPVIKIFFLTALSFVVTIAWTPLLTHILYKYKLGKQIRDQASAPVYAELHKRKSGTPTMGGILIWGTTLVLAAVLYAIRFFTDSVLFDWLSFLTRSQTLLPLGALVAAALVGLVDDLFNIRRRGVNGGGLKIRYKLLIYSAIAAVGAWWFFAKLDWTVLHVPFVGNLDIGWWYVPIFIFVIVATSFSVNETDGLDGLAGGVLLTSFAAYSVIALVQGRYDLAAFCGVIMGALLAFLWFNIPPARFIMGDTGAMALGTTLGIVAMLTNSALILPVIGAVLVFESLSVIVQLTYRRVTGGRKLLRSAPIHHHLEAIGWAESKIVMRFWVISSVTAVIGLMLVLLDTA